MFCKKSILKTLKEFIASPRDGKMERPGLYSKREVEQVNQFVREILEYEREQLLDSDGDQLGWFKFLLKTIGGSSAKPGEIGKLILVKWSKKSRNFYAQAYKIGLTHGHMDGSKHTKIRLQKQRRKALSQAGERGSNAKHLRSRELKLWAIEKAKQMKGSDMDIARKLSMQLPSHLGDVSVDPKRFIYDAIRAVNVKAAVRIG